MLHLIKKLKCNGQIQIFTKLRKQNIYFKMLLLLMTKAVHVINTILVQIHLSFDNIPNTVFGPVFD